VRGTPASGKSTVLHLLHQYIHENEPSALVYRLDGWTRDGIHYVDKLSSQVEGFPSNVDKTYLLFDEGQDTYDDHLLWNGFFKGLPAFGAFYVAIFCSYGSPGNRATPYSQGTPLRIGDHQRIQLWPTETTSLGLLLTRQELDTMIEQRHPRLFVDQATRELLFQWTRGYVGFIEYFLKSIRTKVSVAFSYPDSFSPLPVRRDSAQWRAVRSGHIS
jgi:predicted AAA+ superfamily ATPase